MVASRTGYLDELKNLQNGAFRFFNKPCRRKWKATRPFYPTLTLGNIEVTQVVVCYNCGDGGEKPFNSAPEGREHSTANVVFLVYPGFMEKNTWQRR